MFKPFGCEKPAELLSQPGLEYWFRERRTVNDFRRGPLGSHFDGFAAYLKAEGYSCSRATEILGKCCQLNAFLVDRGITKCEELSESLLDSFLDVSLEISEPPPPLIRLGPMHAGVSRGSSCIWLRSKHWYRQSQRRLRSLIAGFSIHTYDTFGANVSFRM
jgi:hypothetical protein